MKLVEICRVSEESSHKKDLESIVAFNNRIFSAADDGKVKIWSVDDLKLLHEFQAHDYAINHLLIFSDRLYTASVDQTIKSWQMDTWKLVATLEGHEEPPRKLSTDGQFIYSGDDRGDIYKWTKDGDLVGKYDVLEEVWDMHVKKDFIYTIRDRGMTISQLKWVKEEEKQNIVLCSLEGRSPMYITDRDIFVVNHSGVNVDRYTNNPPKCEYIGQFKGHVMIITVLTGWNDYIISGGWDQNVILWSTKSSDKVAEVQIPACPNAIVSTGDGSIFIGGADGYLLKLKCTE